MEKDGLTKWADDEMSVYRRIYAIRDLPLKERMPLIRSFLQGLNGKDEVISNRSIKFLIRSTQIKAKNGALR